MGFQRCDRISFLQQFPQSLYTFEADIFAIRRKLSADLYVCGQTDMPRLITSLNSC